MFGIPNNLLPAALTATATLIGAFLGACIAQFFSHRLTLSREKINGQKVNYQHLYSPVLLETFLYYDVSTAFRREDNFVPYFDEDSLLDSIIIHIGKNLMYAPPQIISIYYQITKDKYTHDEAGTGIHKELYKLQLIEEFLNELSTNNTFDKINKKNVKKYRTLYHLYQIILVECGDMGKARKLLSHHFYLSNKKLTKNSNYKIIKLYYFLFKNYYSLRKKTSTFTDFTTKVAPYIFLRISKDFEAEKLLKVLKDLEYE
ncbi:hypothetical protein [Bacillus mycoides]|uniref:hypothetical protein n=1 Tax=Bacillus mycoides TaxID=1405 RepID=UPI001C01E383|nr:hypothetical protein [Bacillus mycoides]QWG36719.1 hypothetical protein EXW30_28395 [Bacillus mycoides]